VPALVRSDNDLPTLRVHLRGPAGTGKTSRGSEPVAAFQVLRGPGPVTWTETVPTRQLGLADWIRSVRDVHESDFALPGPVATAASDALRRLSRPDDPACWLELPPPRGYLHFLPWERLLSPSLDRPLLRLPNFTLRPSAPGASMRVVLVVAQAPTKRPFDVPGTVEELTRCWLMSTGRSVTLEVFVTPDDVDTVRDLFADNPAVTVHDPRTVRTLIPGVSGNGWVAWVRTALAGRAADVVHVVGHGTLAGEHGALALPNLRIGETSPARHGTLGAVDLCTSLNRAGAWGLVMTSPPSSHCPAALRDLADAVAQARPGVVALHELDAADATEQMWAMLRMLIDGRPPSGSLPGVMCWSHPSFVAFPDEATPLCGSDGTSTLIAEATHDVLAQVDTPAWVAAGARSLEALQARVMPTGGEPPDPDAVAALEAVSQLFEQHVRTYGPPTTSGEATS
jgi:hypothetical protein